MKHFFLGYIDPGLGALIWQSIVAAFVGLFFYLKKNPAVVCGCVSENLGSKTESSRNPHCR